MVWDTFSSLEEWKGSSDSFHTPYDALQEKASYELNPSYVESLGDYGHFIDYEDALYNTPDEMIAEELKLALDDKLNS